MIVWNAEIDRVTINLSEDQKFNKVHLHASENGMKHSEAAKG
jgi:hypothetical protein